VNFLNLGKNMRKPPLSQLCHSEVQLWRQFGGVGTRVASVRRQVTRHQKVLQLE